jgi:hypothetical protein
LIGRTVFDDVGLFGEDLSRLEEWDWLPRFAELYDIMFVSKPLADIYAPMWEKAYSSNEDDPTLQSIRAIARKHLPRFRGRGGVAFRQFRSTFYLKTAATMYRKRQPVGAIRNVLRSLWVYPFRNGAFFRFLWRSVRSLARE